MVLPGSSLEDIWEHRLEFESLEDFQSSVSMLPHPHLGTRGAGKAQGVEAFSAICRLCLLHGRLGSPSGMEKVLAEP